jgi:capsular exopolysaccharide synthesis family protein
MSDQAANYSTTDRSTWAANFFSRLNRYRNLVRRRWWVVILIVVIAVGVEGALIWFTPPIFSSTGRMIVGIKLQIQEGSMYNEEMANFIGTQAALMQSGTVLSRAQARVAAQKPDAATQKNQVSMNVTVIPKTTIFVLRATGEDPQYVQQFLQAAMEEYINFKKEMRAQTSDTTLAGLTEEILRLEREARKADEELSAYQATNSIVMMEEQGNTTGKRLASLTQRLAETRSEYDLLQSLTAEMVMEPPAQPKTSTPANSESGDEVEKTSLMRPSTARNNEFFMAKQQITMLKAELASLSRFLRPKHPKIVALNGEIVRRQQLMQIYLAEGQEELQNRKRALLIGIQSLEKDVKECDALNLEIGRKMADYQRLKSASARVQATYLRLQQTMQTLDVNKQITPEGVTVMERATAAQPSRAELSRSLLMASLVGLGISIAILLLLDKLDDRLNSFTELEQSFDETVLGQIPREKAGKRRRSISLLQADDPRHSFVEAYRNLRSSLLYLSVEGERPRTLIVTSSIPNDGKSMTAANLAITMASAGSQVLLVDGDLRKGVLDGRFGLPSEPGFSEVLSKGVNWMTTVQPTQVPNLFLLPRGATTHKSAELFLGPVMGAFLKETAAKYDYVIFDTAPVMAADDVTSMAPRVDGVVFVIRAEHTSGRVARSALDLLYQRQARICGIVFNGVRARTGDYYYYYKYKDYYRKYPTSAAAKTT